MAVIDFPTSPTVGQEFILGNVTWTWDGVKWTAYPGALAIPDAPVDGQQYARQNASWSVVAGGGGGIADAPSDGTLYGRKSAAWTHLSHTDITDWAAPHSPTSRPPRPPRRSWTGRRRPGLRRPSLAAITSIRRILRATRRAIPPASRQRRKSQRLCRPPRPQLRWRMGSLRLERVGPSHGRITFIPISRWATTASSTATCGSTRATTARAGRRTATRPIDGFMAELSAGKGTWQRGTGAAIAALGFPITFWLSPHRRLYAVLAS